MTELTDFASKAEAERFLDELERTGGQAAMVFGPLSGRWLVEYERPADPVPILAPCPESPPCAPSAT